MATRIYFVNMHYQLCPLSESRDEEASGDNSDCEDCALIAAAYAAGYEEGWIDAGEGAMNTIQDSMAKTANDIYEKLLMGEIPSEKFGRVQVFK